MSSKSARKIRELEDKVSALEQIVLQQRLRIEKLDENFATLSGSLLLHYDEINCTAISPDSFMHFADPIFAPIEQRL